MTALWPVHRLRGRGALPRGIVVAVRRGGTDQEGQGRRVGIPYARGAACPVKALDVWLSAAGITEGPVFSPEFHAGAAQVPAASWPSADAVQTKQRPTCKPICKPTPDN